MDKVEDIVGGLFFMEADWRKLSDLEHEATCKAAIDLIQSQQALIEEMRSQIGDDAVIIDGEWGIGRSRSEIEADGDMPDCYYRAKALSQKE